MAKRKPLFAMLLADALALAGTCITKAKTKLLAANVSIALLLTPTTYAQFDCNAVPADPDGEAALAKQLNDFENGFIGLTQIPNKQQMIRNGKNKLINDYYLLHGIDSSCDQPRRRLKSSTSLQSPKGSISVRMKKERGTYVLPVLINNAITLDFVLDSGAADVTVPADVFRTLVRTGSIKDSDITGKQTYVLADGSKSQSFTFTIRSLKVGDKVVENVRGSVAATEGSLLLGQSFLERFDSWSIDNTNHELLLAPRLTTAVRPPPNQPPPPTAKAVRR